jgi:glycosyltransferase involved in cell wall biosynthesis
MQKNSSKKLISIVVPVFNESGSLPYLYEELRKVVTPLPYRFEIIFVNDGSSDNSLAVAKSLPKNSIEIKILDFSRNFGKEAATSAGLYAATGAAAIIMDADLQHPASYIPKFIDKWEAGAEVVIGVRNKSMSDTRVKKIGSYVFYKILNQISETEIIPRSTDFRLIDRGVLIEFNRLTEHNRMTRGLIDWLGFRRDFVYFNALERMHGEASYKLSRLIRLALTGFISHSLLPLRLAGYTGIVIMICSGVLGVVMLLDRYLTLPFHFSGPAILADLILLLVGLVLVSLGILAFYIGHMYHELQNRPLYIVRKDV